MCGRFAQFEARTDYIDALDSPVNYSGAFDPQPIGRYNIAPGNPVLLLRQREAQLCLDPVTWGYQPKWAKASHQPVMINARAETAAYSRMFKSLWRNGRALVMADGWYEWKQDPLDARRKQPYFIYQPSRQPLFFAAISHTHPQDELPHGDDGFVILTAASDGGLLDIHDRRPLVLPPAAARQWLDPDFSSDQAWQLVSEYATPASEFICHPVSRAVGNVHNEGSVLINPIADPVV